MAGAVVATGYGMSRPSGHSAQQGRVRPARRTTTRRTTSRARVGGTDALELPEFMRAGSSTAGNPARMRWIVGIALAITMGATLGFLPGTSFSLSHVEADAGAGESVAQRVETVQAGDSLWVVAQRTLPGEDTRKSMDRIRKLNQLQDNGLRPGQELLIPTR
ncbi:MAG: LysM peptidoglycan-binding domain-containing protein [Candidatus Nanopelagicales bacterium]